MSLFFEIRKSLWEDRSEIILLKLTSFPEANFVASLKFHGLLRLSFWLPWHRVIWDTLDFNFYFVLKETFKQNKLRQMLATYCGRMKTTWIKRNSLFCKIFFSRQIFRLYFVKGIFGLKKFTLQKIWIYFANELKEQGRLHI